MLYQELTAGANAPNDINVLIEISSGGEPVKYELDKASGALVVDRILSTSMRYPGNYGFVPRTLGADGDPLDVLVISEPALVPGSIISCRPIGVLRMADEAGGDEKIIAVPSKSVSRHYDLIHSLDDIADFRLKMISHFFLHYKGLESGKWVKLDGWGNREEAMGLIREGLAREGVQAKPARTSSGLANPEAARQRVASQLGANIVDMQAMIAEAFQSDAGQKAGDDWFFESEKLPHRRAG